MAKPELELGVFPPYQSASNDSKEVLRQRVEAGIPSKETEDKELPETSFPKSHQ